MRTKLLLCVGLTIGNFGYQLLRYGPTDADWTRAIFVSVFTSLAVLLLPSKWMRAKEGN
jgi:hypothetical protein